MKLEIATPDKSFPAVEIHSVTLPTEKGEAMILPGHAPLISRLGVGTLRYESASESKTLSITQGVVHVLHDHIVVLCDEMNS